MIAPTPPELQAAAKQVKTLVNLWDLAMVSDTLKFDLDAIEDTAAVIIESIDKLKNLTTIKSQMTVLNDTERSLSLKDAIATIAGDLRGGQVFAPDTFKSGIERACDPAHRDFWERESSGLMVTLIDEKNGISDLLKDEGVLVWTAGEFDPADDCIRVVNTRWLTDESDIYSFVVNDFGSGKFCRFCNGLEGPNSFELQAVNAKERNVDFLRSGGKRVAILQTGVVHTHEPCKKYWQEWVRVAEKLEEAAA